MRTVILLPLLGMAACSHRLATNDFRVVPAQPQYLLRSPDAMATPFPDILSRYNGFVPGKGWLDLTPEMELRVENAYYKTGVPKRGLNGYLGTEVAQYRVQSSGALRMLSVKSMQDRPEDQEPVQQLLSEPQKKYRHHRFYFEVLFHGGAQGSVVLGADSADDIRRLADQLSTQPDAVCNSRSPHCTVFPEVCSVSLEMRIYVNGKPQTVMWGSSLASVAGSRQDMKLFREYQGSLKPVDLDAHDPQALRLPLLPGDHVRWN